MRRNSGWAIRRLLPLAAVCAVIGSAAGAGAPQPAQAASGSAAATGPPSITLTSGPTVAGQLDLRRVTLAQSAGDLVLTFATTRPFVVSTFHSPGRLVCLETGPREVPSQWQKLCIVGSAGPHAIFRFPIAHGGPRAKWVAASIVRPNWNTAVVTFSQADATIGPGLWDFQLQTVWEGTSTCTTAAPCRDSLPHSAVALWRIDHYAVDGCVAAGASEVYNGPAAGRTVALSFDDGPSPYTPQILGILKAHHVPATFFEVGEEVAAYPTFSRWALGEGSAIGDHTWSHPILTTSNVVAQVGAARAEIVRQTGYSPCLVRPPYGIAPASIVDAIRGMGMLTVQWDVDPRDWSLPGVSAIVANVLANVHPGAIVLMHDGGGPRSETVAATRIIVPALLARGYRLVTVPQMLGLHVTYRYSP